MSNNARSERRGLGLLLTACLLLRAPAASMGAEDRSAAGVFFPAESEQQVLWQRIERARDAKNWDAVLDGLARFAELVTRPDLNTVLEGGGGMAWGVRRVFHELVASLPPEELVRYRARLDPLVSGLWEKSRLRASPEEHGRLRHLVLRDLRDTTVYPQALKEEMDDAFEAGRWLEARKACEDFLALEREGIAGRRAPSPEDVVRARVLLAQACAVLGDVAAARSQVDALKSIGDGGAAGKPLPDELKSQVKALVGTKIEQDSAGRRAAEPLQESALEPPVFTAGSGAGTGESPFRLGGVIWERRAIGSRLRSFVVERERGSASGGVPLPYYPVAKDGLIVFQHADRICAYATGQAREIWSHPLDPSREDLAGVHAPLLGPDACYFGEGQTLHALQLADGKPLWQKSFVYNRGEKTLYLVDGAAPDAVEPGVEDEGAKEAEPAQLPGEEEKEREKKPGKDVDDAPRGGSGKEKVEDGDKPSKEAGDTGDDEGVGDDKQKDGARKAPAKRNGKFAAKVIKAYKSGSPPPRISCSLSPAIQVRDRIVLAVHVRVGQEILQHLACVDRQGDEVWTAFLGSAQGGNYLGLGGTASIPLSDGENVYHLTNTGMLAAVDGDDGAILWITAYAGISARGKREAIRNETRWQPNPILSVGPELIVAPQDAPFLLGIQKETGEVIWRAPRESRSALVGADSRACFVVGRDAAAIVHSGPERGRVLWKFTPAGPGGACEPTGRAFLAKDALLIPGRDALLCVSPRDGRLLSQTLWDFSGVGGNLLLTRAASPAVLPPTVFPPTVLPPTVQSQRGAPLLAVANPGGVLVYSGFEAESARVASLPADRTETLLERAKFHLKSSELDTGLAMLRSWKDSAPPAPPPNSILDHLHLDLAEIIEHLVRDQSAGPHAVELLRFRVALERMPRRRVAAAIELSSRLEQGGDAAGALEALHDALALDNPATDYSPDGSLDVPSSAYIRDRIRSLRKSAGDPAKISSAIDSAAREALRGAQNRLRTPAAYLEVIRLFPFTPAAAEAYIDLSRLCRDGQSYDLAVNALDGYLNDYPDGAEPRQKDPSQKDARVEELVRVKLLAAGLLRRAGRVTEARERYLEVLAHHPAVRVQGIDGARPGETVAEFAKPLLGDPSLLAAASEEPAVLKFPVRMGWRSPADLQATKRTFLTPSGAPPEPVKGCFLTQSEDEIELRAVETGLPVWKTYLEMVPGFEFDDPTRGRGFSLPRSGRRAFSGRFVDAGAGAGATLVLQDERNVFAVDPAKGTVRWHVPIGPDSTVKDSAVKDGAVKDTAVKDGAVKEPADPFRPHLREKLRGAQVTDTGVFASTSHGRLLRLNLKGEGVWETKLEYSPATYPPFVFKDRVFVLSQPPGIRVHSAETGEEVKDEKLAALKEQLKEPFLRAPLELAGGRLVLITSGGLRCVDLGQRAFAWKLERKGTIEEASYFPEFPDECLVVSNSRANGWPSIAAVSLSDGRELWRFEKFPPARASVHVVREKNRFYVLHGADQWTMLAIQVREGVEREKPIVETLWPHDISLGHNGGSMLGRLHVGGDSVFFLDTDNHSISVYDKLAGTSRSAQTSVISRFTTEKEDCSLSILQGKLVILSDGGDCAFESAAPGTAGAGLFIGAKSPLAGAEGVPLPGADGLVPPAVGGAPWNPAWGSGQSGGMDLLRHYMARPGSLESTSKLALQYFKGGDRESAIDILNRALLSEDLLEENGAEKRFLLSYLLDGIKEEHMKESVPRIASHRFLVSPSIDGDLSDGWDISTCIHMNTPKNVGTIPGPGQLRDWEGEEDLSAVLYTGWDDKYFYFALDVSDDVLYPYDKDAENWKGDCLIIGLDPTNDEGWHQRGNDQLMTLALTIPKRNKLDKKKDEQNQGEDQEDEEEDETRKPDGLFSVKKKDDDSGAIYEVGLPWSSFDRSFQPGVPPIVGYTFGLSLLLTDDDTGQGATKTLSLNPCHLLPRNQKNSPVWRFIIPYFFPKVTLE